MYTTVKPFIKLAGDKSRSIKERGYRYERKEKIHYFYRRDSLKRF